MHCLDLLCENTSKLPEISEVVKAAKILVTFSTGRKYFQDRFDELRSTIVIGAEMKNSPR